MTSILDILNEIANDPSTKAKEAILKREEKNETLREVFAAAYDPTISYYIKKIPAVKKHDEDSTLADAITRLKNLASRQVTGGAGVEYLSNILISLTEDDATVIARIIERDLKCGCSDSIASRVWPKLVPEFPYMRCSLLKGVKVEKWDWKKGVISQMKGDGMFANVDLADGDAVITSRNGKQFPAEKFTNLIADVLTSFPTDYRVIGELLVERNGKVLAREIGNGILNSVSKGGDFDKGDKPVYMVWDIVPSKFAVASGRFETPYIDRFNALKSYLLNKTVSSVSIIETCIVHSMDEAYTHYFKLVAQGFEGTIIKNPEGVWFDGTSKDQVKLKVECDVDLEITGFNEGKGKNAATFGSIECASSDRLLIVNVSGFTDKDREDIHARRKELMNTIMAVKFNNIMPPSGSGVYSLFLPRFAEFRNDKTVADSLARVIEQFEAIIKAE